MMKLIRIRRGYPPAASGGSLKGCAARTARRNDSSATRTFSFWGRCSSGQLAIMISGCQGSRLP